ncbi:hypothetical protein ACFWGD_11030 [Corynebacterium sp. NPDC060344]|uniref:hypothetical protein n=1 Tax=Corynebacterium sp. NPDC060344 TaxID=3347101 RepID=UPI00365C5E6F
MTVMDVWRVRVGFRLSAEPTGKNSAGNKSAGESLVAVTLAPELERHLKRFPGAGFEFDAASNAGAVDVVVEGPSGHWGSPDADHAAAVAAGIVDDVAGAVLKAPSAVLQAPSVTVPKAPLAELQMPLATVATTVIGDAEIVPAVVVWGGADHDAPIPDSERHRFLRRRGLFGDRARTAERRETLDFWHDDVDVKTAITAGF